MQCLYLNNILVLFLFFSQKTKLLFIFNYTRSFLNIIYKNYYRCLRIPF